MSILGGLNGSIGESYGTSSSVGQSYGSSANYGYNFGESSSWENSYSDSWNQGENWANSWEEGENSSWNRVFGREASAQDIYRAMEANEQQRENWLMQAEYNAREAEKNRQYQAYMSNTAYQRAVQDLLKAGLNPILAVGNMGASTPVGATASSALSASHKATTYAESQGGSYGYNKGGSSSYGYNKGGSHSESSGGSKSYNKGENWGSSSESSYNRSQSLERSMTSNNIAEVAKNSQSISQAAIGALNDIYKSGSAKMKSVSDSIKKGVSNVKNKISNGIKYPKATLTH